MTLIQRGQRAYLDSAVAVDSLTGAAAENANYTLDLSGGNAYLIIRQEIEATGGFPETLTNSLLEFRINGGSWTALTTSSSPVRINSTHACTSADAAVMGDILTTSAVSFLNMTFDNNGTHAGRTFNSAAHGETGTAVEFIAASFSHNDTVEFRYINAGQWDNIIVITIDKGAGISIPVVRNHLRNQGIG